MASHYNEPTWVNQLKAARALPSSELERHAMVSVQNNHRCHDCFCCAALTILEDRQRDEYRKHYPQQAYFG